MGWAYENAAQELLGYYNSFLGVDALVARTSRTTQTLWVRQPSQADHMLHRHQSTHQGLRTIPQMYSSTNGSDSRPPPFCVCVEQKRTEMAGATLGALRAANDLSNTMQHKPGTGATVRHTA